VTTEHLSQEDVREKEQVERDIQDLHEYGYYQSLRRTIGAFTSFALGFAMVSITAGIFTAFATGFVAVGGASIWLWVPALVGVGAILLVYMHLSARMPLTGYAYQWSARLVNPHYGWFTGWCGALAFCSGAAGLSIGFASVFAPYIWNNPTRGQLQLFGIVAIVVCVILNAIGVRAATWVNNVGAGVELVGTVGIAIITAIGVIFFSHTEGPKVLVQTGNLGHTHLVFTSWMLAALLPVYTLLGWEGSADLAEETRDPRKTAPTAMWRSVIISTVAGFFIFAVFAMAIPHGIANTFNQSQAPIIYVLQQQFGIGMADVMKVVAFIAFLSCLIANVAVATRLVYSLSRDRMLPGWQVLSRVNKSTRTPLYVILVVGAIAVTLNLMSAGIVLRIVSIVSVTYYLTYILTTLAALWADRKGTLPPPRPGYFDLGKWLFPVAAVGLAWAVLIIIYLTTPTINQTAGKYTGYAVAIGVLWYVLYLGWRIRDGKAGPSVRPLAAEETAEEREIAIESAVDPTERLRV
jgi:amino acid transporter